MQLIDSTAQNMGVENVFDPEDNIMGGARYLRQLLDRFNGDLRLALAAYNAGPANVDKFGGIPPFAETRNYVNRIINIMSANKIDSKDSNTLADIE
jgi:soluble lytic murein transglycosylase-like protein